MLVDFHIASFFLTITASFLAFCRLCVQTQINCVAIKCNKYSIFLPNKPSVLRNPLKRERRKFIWWTYIHAKSNYKESKLSPKYLKIWLGKDKNACCFQQFFPPVNCKNVHNIKSAHNWSLLKRFETAYATCNRTSLASLPEVCSPADTTSAFWRKRFLSLWTCPFCQLSTWSSRKIGSEKSWL